MSHLTPLNSTSSSSSLSYELHRNHSRIRINGGPSLMERFPNLIDFKKAVNAPPTPEEESEWAVARARSSAPSYIEATNTSTSWKKQLLINTNTSEGPSSLIHILPPSPGHLKETCNYAFWPSNMGAPRLLKTQSASPSAKSCHQKTLNYLNLTQDSFDSSKRVAPRPSPSSKGGHKKTEAPNYAFWPSGIEAPRRRKTESPSVKAGPKKGDDYLNWWSTDMLESPKAPSGLLSPISLSSSSLGSPTSLARLDSTSSEEFNPLPSPSPSPDIFDNQRVKKSEQKIEE